MVFTGSKGITYVTADPPIGKGGEGSIYRINGANDLVLKVLVPAKRTETRRRKLLAMTGTVMPPDIMKQAAWPTDVVYENGRFAGFVMPAVKNTKPLNLIYTGKCSCSLSQRITVAMNLCSCIDAVNRAGQVCGDLNPNNISVDPLRGTITLLDTDSYHITDPVTSAVYRCEVGRPEFLPAEVQMKMKNGYDLRTAPLPTFTEYSDRFALAVHIFSLLMNGCHPFACAAAAGYTACSVAAPQPAENIIKGYFPFAMKHGGLTVPRYAPDYSYLPDNIRKLFHRAFVTGHSTPSQRPEPAEWHRALSLMERDLKKCSVGHQYPSGLGSCPWCAAAGNVRSAAAYRPVLTQQPFVNHTPAGGRLPANTAAAVMNSAPQRLSDWQKYLIFVVLTVMLFGAVFSGIYGNADNMPESSFGTYQDEPALIDFDYGEYLAEMGTDFTGPLTETTLEIPPCDMDVTICRKATTKEISGSISEGETASYSFVPEYNGAHNIQISEIMNGTDISLVLKDRNGYIVASDYHCANPENIGAEELRAGEEYEICLGCTAGSSDYIIEIGCAKDTENISGHTNVFDGIVFPGQNNAYTFTPALDGLYTFSMSEMKADLDVSIEIRDRLDYLIKRESWFGNGDSVTVPDMKAEETYTVRICQHSGSGNYCLCVGNQKPCTQITENTVIYDSTEFPEQENVYLLTSGISGEILIKLSEANADVRFGLAVYDRNGGLICSDYCFENGSGVTIYDVEAGDTYRIVISEKNGNSSYKLAVI